MFDTFFSDPPTPFDAALADHWTHRDAELALRAEVEVSEALADADNDAAMIANLAADMVSL